MDFCMSVHLLARRELLISSMSMDRCMTYFASYPLLNDTDRSGKTFLNRAMDFGELQTAPQQHRRV